MIELRKKQRLGFLLFRFSDEAPISYFYIRLSMASSEDFISK
jgi:hypothetical protein